MDWAAASYRARRLVRARQRLVPERISLALIDAFAAQGTVTAAGMRALVPPERVATILGLVTTAVHGTGHVPAKSGWYRRDENGAFVIDPGFAVAWLAARACDAPLPGPAGAR
ncbi:hypothetical protein [Methylobacterium sp. SyP6R]|uniref:hypothetical protein n=1 Tax=Methylobacterium sp. SyP6R TaxID=2718876 RepID=UPI001F263A3C|nr:hypothetical protein [Methylobacterium sp. SyP6R]MCF4124572.1 hypothetical protein [Methylobacterium sp. SyP6R]